LFGQLSDEELFLDNETGDVLWRYIYESFSELKRAVEDYIYYYNH